MSGSPSIRPSNPIESPYRLQRSMTSPLRATTALSKLVTSSPTLSGLEAALPSSLASSPLARSAVAPLSPSNAPSVAPSSIGRSNSMSSVTSSPNTLAKSMHMGQRIRRRATTDNVTEIAEAESDTDRSNQSPPEGIWELPDDSQEHLKSAVAAPVCAAPNRVVYEAEFKPLHMMHGSDRFQLPYASVSRSSDSPAYISKSTESPLKSITPYASLSTPQSSPYASLSQAKSPAPLAYAGSSSSSGLKSLTPVPAESTKETLTSPLPPARPAIQSPPSSLPRRPPVAAFKPSAVIASLNAAIAKE